MRYLLPLMLIAIFIHFQAKASVFYSLPSGKVIQILELDEATKEIIDDSGYPFFNLLTKLDISAQLRMKIDSIDKKQAIELLKREISGNVLKWDPAEIESIKKSMISIDSVLVLINNTILPDTLKFLKIEGKQYGVGMNYTVNNCIVLTQQSVSHEDLLKIKGIIIHEIFHVFSRLSPGKRKQLYHSLGFQPIDSLVPGDYLISRRLTNPDCQDCQYMFRLKNANGDTIPVTIINNTPSESIGSEHQSINFLSSGFYEIYEQEGICYVKDYKNIPQALDLKQYSGLRERIGRITNYLTNQEEITAMFFSKVVYNKLALGYLDKYSAEDRERLEQFEQLLRRL